MDTAIACPLKLVQRMCRGEKQKCHHRRPGRSVRCFFRAVQDAGGRASGKGSKAPEKPRGAQPLVERTYTPRGRKPDPDPEPELQARAWFSY